MKSGVIGIWPFDGFRGDRFVGRQKCVCCKKNWAAYFLSRFPFSFGGDLLCAPCAWYTASKVLWAIEAVLAHFTETPQCLIPWLKSIPVRKEPK